jgi:hypothetical protein
VAKNPLRDLLLKLPRLKVVTSKKQAATTHAHVDNSLWGSEPPLLLAIYSVSRLVKLVLATGIATPNVTIWELMWMQPSTGALSEARTSTIALVQNPQNGNLQTLLPMFDVVVLMVRPG